MYRILRGCFRIAREGARRAWNFHLAATVFTVALQLVGLYLVSYGAYLAWKPLGFFVGGVLLVWLGNGLQPAPKSTGDNNGPGGA